MQSDNTSHQNLYYKKRGEFISKYRALLSRAFGPFNHIILRAPHRNIGVVPYIVWTQAYMRSCATAKKWLAEDLRANSNAKGVMSSSHGVGYISDTDTEKDILAFANQVFQSELDEVLLSSLLCKKWFNVKALFSEYEPLKDDDNVTDTVRRHPSVYYPIRGEPEYIPYDIIPTVDGCVGALSNDSKMWPSELRTNGKGTGEYYGTYDSNPIYIRSHADIMKRSPIHVFSQELDIIPSCKHTDYASRDTYTASLISSDAFHDIEMTKLLNTLHQQQQEGSYTLSEGSSVGRAHKSDPIRGATYPRIMPANPGYIIIPFTALHSLKALCTGRVEGSLIRRQMEGQSAPTVHLPIPPSIASAYFESLVMLLKNQERNQNDHLYNVNSAIATYTPRYVRYIVLPPSFEVNSILKYKNFVDIKALSSKESGNNYNSQEGVCRDVDTPTKENIQLHANASSTLAAALLDDPLCRCGLFSSVISQTWYNASASSSLSLPVKVVTAASNQQFTAKVSNPFRLKSEFGTGAAKCVGVERKTVSRLIQSVDEASPSYEKQGPSREYKMHRGVIDACAEKAISISKRATGV